MKKRIVGSANMNDSEHSLYDKLRKVADEFAHQLQQLGLRFEYLDSLGTSNQVQSNQSLENLSRLRPMISTIPLSLFWSTSSIEDKDESPAKKLQKIESEIASLYDSPITNNYLEYMNRRMATIKDATDSWLKTQTIASREDALEQLDLEKITITNQLTEERDRKIAELERN